MPLRSARTRTSVPGLQYVGGRQTASVEDIQCHAPTTAGVVPTDNRRVTSARRCEGTEWLKVAVTGCPTPTTCPSGESVTLLWCELSRARTDIRCVYACPLASAYDTVMS